MGGMWHELAGLWAYAAGAAGTVTLPAGALILQVKAHSSSGTGTVSILGGTNIPVGGDWLNIQFLHDLVQTSTNGSLAIVFTGTDSYFVEYTYPNTTSAG
jgi:hypothetical protein